ncbi:MAG: TonB-dependent receptor [Bacteroidota bacterium]
MRLPFVLIALLAALPAAQAQVGSVRGTVTDATSRVPLQGATVRLLPESAEADTLGAATDGDGRFDFRRVAPGAYTMRVTFIGYVAANEALTVAMEETVERSIELVPDTTAFGRVRVTAAREGGAAALTAGLQTVTPADLALAPVPGVGGDLAAYLQTLPAVTTVGDRGGQLYVRGGEPSQTLTRVNGLRVLRPFHILGFYSAIPTEVVDEADVWAGAFPARHGGALSAVLDVRARSGNADRLAASAALAPTLSAVHLEGPLVPGRVSALVSVRESLLEQFLPTWLGQRLPYRFGDAFATVDARLIDGLSFGVTGLRSHDAGQIAGTLESFLGDAVELDPTSDSLDVRWSDEALGASLGWAPRAIPLTVTLEGHGHRATSGFGPEDPPADPTALDARRQSRVEGWEVAGNAALAVGPGSVRLGAMLYDASVSYRLADRFVGLTADTSDVREVAIWGEAEARFGSVRALAGLRAAQFQPVDAWGIAPSFRLAWEGRGVLREVSVGAGIAHQGVTGVQDGRDVGDVFTAYVPVPEGADLPRAEHLVMGSRWQVNTGDGGTLRVAAEGYAKRFSGLQIARLDPFPGFTAALDPGDGEAIGGDLRVDLNQPLAVGARLALGVGLGLARVRYETDAGGSFAPSHDRRATLHATGRVDWNRWSFSAVVQAGDGLPYTPSAGFEQWIPIRTPDTDVRTEAGQTRVLYGERGSRRLPTYLRADLWASRRLTEGRVSTTLQAGVVNVTNRANPFYFDLFTLRRADQLPAFPSIGLKVDIR